MLPKEIEYGETVDVWLYGQTHGDDTNEPRLPTLEEV